MRGVFVYVYASTYVAGWLLAWWYVLEDSVRRVAIRQSLHHWPWNGVDCLPDQEPIESRPARCSTVRYAPTPVIPHLSLSFAPSVAGRSVDGTEINRMPEGRMIHWPNAVRVSVGMERGRVRLCRIHSPGNCLSREYYDMGLLCGRLRGIRHIRRINF